MENANTYKKRDNPYKITLLKNGAKLSSEEMQAIAKFELKHGNTYYSSVDHPGCFARDNNDSSITIWPYDMGIPPSIKNVKIIIYDNGDFQHGVVWGGGFMLNVDGSVQPIE